jgi:rubrerythrin
MKASLLHPLREPRHARRHRRGRGRGGRAPDGDSQTHEPDVETTAAPAAERIQQHAHAVDPAAQRVREAGGPIDLASYTCSCGYLFSASVSTSVVCPHCGADQAW